MTRHPSMALIHEHDLIGDSLRLVEEVGAHDDGASPASHIPDQVENGPRRFWIEAGGGFVQQQHGRFVEDRPGERQAGAHSGGIAAYFLVEGVPDAEPLRGFRNRSR